MVSRAPVAVDGVARPGCRRWCRAPRLPSMVSTERPVGGGAVGTQAGARREDQSQGTEQHHHSSVAVVRRMQKRMHAAAQKRRRNSAQPRRGGGGGAGVFLFLLYVCGWAQPMLRTWRRVPAARAHPRRRPAEGWAGKDGPHALGAVRWGGGNGRGRTRATRGCAARACRARAGALPLSRTCGRCSKSAELRFPVPNSVKQRWHCADDGTSLQTATSDSDSDSDLAEISQSDSDSPTPTPTKFPDPGAVLSPTLRPTPPPVHFQRSLTVHSGIPIQIVFGSESRTERRAKVRKLSLGRRVGLSTVPGSGNLVGVGKSESESENALYHFRCRVFGAVASAVSQQMIVRECSGCSLHQCHMSVLSLQAVPSAPLPLRLWRADSLGERSGSGSLRLSC
eukprot:gene22516-biopygen20747